MELGIIYWLYPLLKGKIPPFGGRGIFSTKLTCIWWWGFSFGDLWWGFSFGFSFIGLAQSTGAVEYIDCTSVPNECPRYDTKQSDGEVQVMLELWEMWSTPSSPSLPSPLWPGVVVPEKSPIYRYLCKIELFKIELFWHWNCVLMLSWIARNRSTVDRSVESLRFQVSIVRR